MTKSRQLSVQAKGLYRHAGAKERFLAAYRPFICPFDVLMEYVPEGGRVLDVGCGSGLWLHLLRRSGRISSGVGFDVNAVKTGVAKAIGSDEDSVEFVCLNDEENWPKGPFDVVTMIDVLHHVRSDKQCDFIGRLCGAGASRVVLKDIDPRARFKRFMNTVHDMVLSRQVPEYCGSDRAAGWLRQAGYRVIENFRCDRLWYSHYLIVAEKD